jgi:hypothetical protein
VNRALDFSKAFDTVNHGILLAKLNKYGIRGIPNDWIKSYLENRSQFCTHEGIRSNTRNISCGVPQGSILGPLLFLLYINDLHMATATLDIILYADDSNPFLKGKTISEIESKMTTEMPNLVCWLQSNRLSLNVGKTHAMVFGTKNDNLKNYLKFKFNGVTLDVVSTTKFLGVVIDDQLKWKEHINYITKKVAKATGIISIARRVFDKQTLKQLYYTFVYPYLIFGNIVWGKSGDTTIWPLFRLQKRIIRMINNVNSRISSSPFFKEMNILKLPDLHILVVGVFMHKYKNNKLPRIVDNIFTENNQYHTHSTRGASRLRPPRSKLKIATKFVKNTGVRLWNKLEINENFNINTSITTFKKYLKKEILKKSDEFGN